MPVGEGSKPGDCIIIRYGSPNQFEVMVVDGGTIDSGKAVVERLRFLCGRNVVISHMVCSHPDADHSSGLREVLDNLKVVNLWLHVPWSHAADTRHYFKDVRWTDEGLARKIREEYDITDELVRLAIKQGSKILEPFQGADIGPFTVLSPSRYAYTRLLPQF